MSRALAFVVLAGVALFARPVTATCGNVVCPRLAEFEAENCNACEKAFKVANASPDDGICCKEFRCKADPDRPCCGRTCPINDQAEADASCNLLTGSDVLDSLNPAFGTFSAVLVREARPDKGKCCNKYKCTQDLSAQCAAQIAKQPCNDVCPTCYTRSIVTPANPTAGICCPVIRCTYNPTQCCNLRDNQNCPAPTCDAQFENAVQYQASNPTQLNCCPRLRCEVDQFAVCAAKLLADPLGPDNRECSACEVSVITREADPAKGRCYPERECVINPSDRCCGFNSSTCEPAPSCGPFADLELVQPVNIFEGQCCPRFACVNNNTRICAAFDCEYASEIEYQAARCPNPPGRNWYFIEIKKPADIDAGRCCPTYKCRETVEKKLYDAESNLRRRRRRRRSIAPTSSP